MNSGAVSGFSSQIAASSGSIGDNTSGKYPCVYRGIESPYGDLWQFVDGVNINDHQAWVCKNADQYASNLFTAPYEQLSYVNTNLAGYLKAMGYDPALPFAEFPVEVGAGAHTYYSDFYYRSAGQRIALLGGRWSNSLTAGPSHWYLGYSSAGARVNIGGRLVKKPL